MKLSKKFFRGNFLEMIVARIVSQIFLGIKSFKEYQRTHNQVYCHQLPKGRHRKERHLDRDRHHADKVVFNMIQGHQWRHKKCLRQYRFQNPLNQLSLVLEIIRSIIQLNINRKESKFTMNLMKPLGWFSNPFLVSYRPSSMRFPIARWSIRGSILDDGT